MRSTKLPWIILLVLWIPAAAWWHICQIKQLCINDAPGKHISPTDIPALHLADGDRFRLHLPGNFSFARSEANANLNTLGGPLDSLTAYLKSGTGGPAGTARTMTITGYYAPDETNKTTFANLGLARAEALKQFFVQQGIAASSLLTKGETQAGDAANNGATGLTFTPAKDSLYGGIGFAFEQPKTTTMPMPAATSVPVSATTSLPATETELAAAQRFTSVLEPIDLYFSMGEASYIKTDETVKFFAEAANYLATHKNQKLLLTGHTDNSGPDAVNRQLSRDRANDVKLGLRKSGIAQGQIVVEAKGETVPKYPNNTRAGRRANRRVTVVVR